MKAGVHYCAVYLAVQPALQTALQKAVGTKQLLKIVVFSLLVFSFSSVFVVDQETSQISSAN